MYMYSMFIQVYKEKLKKHESEKFSLFKYSCKPSKVHWWMSKSLKQQEGV